MLLEPLEDLLDQLLLEPLEDLLDQLSLKYLMNHLNLKFHYYH